MHLLVVVFHEHRDVLDFFSLGSQLHTFLGIMSATPMSRIASLKESLQSMLKDTRDMQNRVAAARYAEHCKRGYVNSVLVPEAQTAIGEDSDVGMRNLVQATIMKGSQTGGDLGASVRAAQDMQRAHQLSALNPLANQLQRLSDEYVVETGVGNVGSNGSLAVSRAGLVHEGARRGL